MPDKTSDGFEQFVSLFLIWGWAVARHWIALIGGAGASVALVVWGRQNNGAQFPQQTWWLGILMGFVLACYLAWTVEYVAKTNALEILDDRVKKKAAKEGLASSLAKLSLYEQRSWNGKDYNDFEILKTQLAEVERDVQFIAEQYLDTSVLDRYMAVNVSDTPVVDDAERQHFTQADVADFWPYYKIIKGRRDCLKGILAELSSSHS